VPSPKRSTYHEKEKEEEELQLALAISLSENQHSRKDDTKASAVKHVWCIFTQEKRPLFTVRALYDFNPSELGELALKKGDTVPVYDNTTYPDWWKGSNRGSVGIFPANYVEKISENLDHQTQVVDVDEISVILNQAKSVRELKKLISESDPLNASPAANERLQFEYQKVVEMVPSIIKYANEQRNEQGI
jgi:signal transducing adaptor molecule